MNTKKVLSFVCLATFALAEKELLTGEGDKVPKELYEYFDYTFDNSKYESGYKNYILDRQNQCIKKEAECCGFDGNLDEKRLSKLNENFDMSEYDDPKKLCEIIEDTCLMISTEKNPLTGEENNGTDDYVEPNEFEEKYGDKVIYTPSGYEVPKELKFIFNYSFKDEDYEMTQSLYLKSCFIYEDNYCSEKCTECIPDMTPMEEVFDMGDYSKEEYCKIIKETCDMISTEYNPLTGEKKDEKENETKTTEGEEKKDDEKENETKPDEGEEKNECSQRDLRNISGHCKDRYDGCEYVRCTYIPDEAYLEDCEQKHNSGEMDDYDYNWIMDYVEKINKEAAQCTTNGTVLEDDVESEDDEVKDEVKDDVESEAEEVKEEVKDDEESEAEEVKDEVKDDEESEAEEVKEEVKDDEESEDDTESIENTKTVSTEGKCGKEYGKCKEGYCCSQYGYCGKTEDYCGKGCQSEFGQCDANATATTETANNEGKCGKEFGKCKEGYCCSKYGYCGKTEEYCGNGCQSEFGQCDANATATTANNEGKCGKEFGKCKEGYCCSQYGYCGKTEEYCGKGCQSEFGQCN